MTRTLIVFAREPDPATCKTRLAGLLTPDERVGFYTAMLRDLAETVRAILCDRRVLCHASDGPAVTLHELFPDVQSQRQANGDLGDRMLAAFRDALPTGSQDRAVLIGSDAPLLTSSDIGDAFDLLERRQLVLAPSSDGGYSLLGAHADALPILPAILYGAPWSTDGILRWTLDRLSALSIEPDPSMVGLLETRDDVDTPDDLIRLGAELEARMRRGAPTAPHTTNWLRHTLPPMPKRQIVYPRSR